MRKLCEYYDVCVLRTFQLVRHDLAIAHIFVWEIREKWSERLYGGRSLWLEGILIVFEMVIYLRARKKLLDRKFLRDSTFKVDFVCIL